MASQELGGLKTHGLSVYFWSWRMIPKTPKKPEHCWWVTPKCSPETCFFWISKKKRQRFHLAMAMVFFSLAKPQTKPLRFNQTAAKPSSRAWATCYLRALSRIGHGVEPPRANREIHILQGVLETPRWGVRWARCFGKDVSVGWNGWKMGRSVNRCFGKDVFRLWKIGWNAWKVGLICLICWDTVLRICHDKKTAATSRTLPESASMEIVFAEFWDCCWGPMVWGPCAMPKHKPTQISNI